MAGNLKPTERHFLGLSPAGFHRNVYYDWAPDRAGAPDLVAVHGMSRNGRDFDALAADLSRDRRVVCPDVVGRGKSDWLPNGALYGYPQYLADANVLIAQLGAQSVDWVGTSMGGLIGMMLAAQPRTPIRRLILNDVGPFIPKGGLERIASYVREVEHFESLAGVEAHLRRILGTFGPLSDAEWAHLTRYSARPLPKGGFGLAYDPAIAGGFQGAPIGDVVLWPVWNMVGCPVLVIRGAQSDILQADTAEEMWRSKSNVTLIEFPECGHAPALMNAAQIGAIRDWLEKTPA